PEIKSTWGPLAYLRSAAAALPELHAYHTNIVFDDGERLMIELYNVIVANGQFVAGGLPIAPQADLRDGLLDVVLVPRRSPAKMVLLAAEMLLGNHLSTNEVIFRRAKKISVRSRPGMWFNVDGELVDALAIGLNSDRSVRALKGVGRPLNNERDRAEVLAALEFVDFVTIFPEIRATRFIEATRPAVYAKGGDYTSETLDAEEKTV